MVSEVRVTIASESAYGANCSLQASAIYFRVSATSGFMPAEPPMMARPQHQLSLDFSCRQHTVTGTSTATPCFKLSLELPRRTGSDVTGASPQCVKDRTAPSTMPPQQQAIGLRHAASICTTLRSNPMYHPCPPFNYKRERPGPFLGRTNRIGRLQLGLHPRDGLTLSGDRHTHTLDTL